MIQSDPTTTRELTLPCTLAAWIDALGERWDLTGGEVLAELLLPVMLYHYQEALYEELTEDTGP